MVWTFLYCSVFYKFSIMSLYHILDFKLVSKWHYSRFPEKTVFLLLLSPRSDRQGWKQQLYSLLGWKVLPHSPISVRCSLISRRLQWFGLVALAMLTCGPLPLGTLCAEGTDGKSSMARCSLFGGDFINTFDESMYSFAGGCSYLLAGDCQKHSFSLIGESGAQMGACWARPWHEGHAQVEEASCSHHNACSWRSLQRVWPGMAFEWHGLPLASPRVSPWEPGGMESIFLLLQWPCPRQHSGNSEVSRAVMNWKGLCNRQIPLYKRGIVAHSWNSEYLAGVKQ